jgi:putative SOS response-associated peptidase YedK
MCAFFNIYTDLKKIKKKLEQLNINITYDDISKSFEVKNSVRLTDEALILGRKEDSPNFTVMNWGIKFSENSPLIFNSRIETIKAEKRWQAIFEKNRCLVPMTAFTEYRKQEDDPAEMKEWKKANKIKKNTPFNISIPEQPFFFAPGIFTYMNGRNYFSIITTEPPPAVKAIPYKRSLAIFDYNNAVDYLFNEPEYCMDKINVYKGDLIIEEGIVNK